MHPTVCDGLLGPDFVARKTAAWPARIVNQSEFVMVFGEPPAAASIVRAAADTLIL